MAHDRYDTRSDRDRGGYSDFDRDRERGRRDERGFFERAGDEVASWFSDDDDRGRREQQRMGGGRGREDERMGWGWGRDRDTDRERGRDRYAIGGWGERDNESDRYAYRGSSGRDFNREREDDDRSYRPMNWTSSQSDYRSGSSGDFRRERGQASSGYGGAFTGSDYERRDFGRGGYDRSETPWGRDDFRRTSNAASRGDYDRDYHSWRQRQLDELDRDYEDYRRENRQRFESDFGSWRQQRQQKRGLLGEIREHMEVVGSDGKSIGKVDCVRGDHVILTKSDSDDNRHHAIKCTMIDKVKDDKVRLEMPAEEAKSRFEDAEGRSFSGRGSEEHTDLERSFAGTYR